MCLILEWHGSDAHQEQFFLHLCKCPVWEEHKLEVPIQIPRRIEIPRIPSLTEKLPKLEFDEGTLDKDKELEKQQERCVSNQTSNSHSTSSTESSTTTTTAPSKGDK